MLKNRIILMLLLQVPCFNAVFAQTLSLSGTVFDTKTRETLIGVAIKESGKTLAFTNSSGHFSLALQPGTHILIFSLLGYTNKEVEISVTGGQGQQLMIGLEQDTRQLSTVVVSAGRYEQKREEVTVSMEVIKAQVIQDKATTSLDNFMNDVPGVNVMDGQANIRGGSGFTYGAGSRVLILVDDMPLLSGDAGDVKWNYLPVENIEQIEVIKGASSALYGSSALNGVIHLRTAFPRDTPLTSASLFSGIYNDPRRNEIIWWGRMNPGYSGAWFTHSQKINNLDLVLSGNYFDDKGYRESEQEQRYRASANFRYRFPGLPGLHAGINASRMRVSGALFILWLNGDSGVYRPGGEVQQYINDRMNIDPYILYYGKHNGRHSLKGRYFNSTNTNDQNQESVGDIYFTEYQYQKKFSGDFVLVGGASAIRSQVHSPELYGDHESRNYSGFAQLDKKFRRLGISFGLRGEYFRTDSTETVSVFNRDTLDIPLWPVFRSGVNYRLFDGTFLRASFGQGYRFPSVAEKFITTNVGALKLFPNPGLRPETGWSAEIAAQQLLEINSWKGYVDLAGFWTEYRDMMEFTFGYYPPNKNPSVLDLIKNFGAKSVNVENARIRGAEITFLLAGKAGKISTVASGGYTYIEPLALNYDPARDTTGTAGTGILKYRFRHMARADLQIEYRNWSTGLSLRYNSFMESIDKSFETELFSDIFPTLHSGLYILPGIKEYREKHNRGDVIFDHRISRQFSANTKVSLITNNIFNREYMTRPGDVQPPRTTVVQVSIRF